MFRKRTSMKKLTMTAAAMLGLSLCFTGCGGKDEPIPEPELQEVLPEENAESDGAQEPEGEGEQAVGDETVIGEREIVNGEMQSYLTGEWTDEKAATRRPIAVMIPNNRPAMPQYGLSRAGIIYEAPVEGRITRLMAVVENFDDLERIGPVRSSRDYYVYMAMGYALTGRQIHQIPFCGKIRIISEILGQISKHVPVVSPKLPYFSPITEYLARRRP